MRSPRRASPPPRQLGSDEVPRECRNPNACTTDVSPPRFVVSVPPGAPRSVRRIVRGNRAALASCIASAYYGGGWCVPPDQQLSITIRPSGPVLAEAPSPVSDCVMAVLRGVRAQNILGSDPVVERFELRLGVRVTRRFYVRLAGGSRGALIAEQPAEGPECEPVPDARPRR